MWRVIKNERKKVLDDVMKVTLINPPIRESKYPGIFPIGLAYIASALMKAGHSVNVIDVNALKYPKNEMLKKIENLDCDVVGIGSMITAYNYVKWLISEIKRLKPEMKIIVGGGVCSAIPEKFMEWNPADIMVLGEGEITIVDLLNNLGNLKNVKGIWYRDKDGVHANPPRELIKNLDSIPFPAWEIFPMDAYLKNPEKDYTKRKMNVLAGRGCPFQCTFCWHNFDYGDRLRSLDNIFEEIKQLQAKYNVEIILFADELFTIRKDFIMEFCKQVKERNVKIKWDCSSRVNTIDKEMMQSMKDAGCINIDFGIESGSQVMLNVMKKGATVEQGKKAVQLIKEVGIRYHTNYIVGIPGETKETIWETVKFCKELNIEHRVEFFYATPYPDTPLYEYAKSKGLIKDEEEFVSKVGEASHFLINLTDMPDEELVMLRNKAQKEAQPYPLTKALFYYKHFGLLHLMRLSAKKMFGS